MVVNKIVVRGPASTGYKWMRQGCAWLRPEMFDTMPPNIWYQEDEPMQQTT